MINPVPGQPPSAIKVVRTTAASAPDSSDALQSFRLPGSGLPTTTARGVSVSMTCWWLWVVQPCGEELQPAVAQLATSYLAPSESYHPLLNSDPVPASFSLTGDH